MNDNQTSGNMELSNLQSTTGFRGSKWKLQLFRNEGKRCVFRCCRDKVR